MVINLVPAPPAINVNLVGPFNILSFVPQLLTKRPEVAKRNIVKPVLKNFIRKHLVNKNASYGFVPHVVNPVVVPLAVEEKRRMIPMVFLSQSQLTLQFVSSSMADNSTPTPANMANPTPVPKTQPLSIPCRPVLANPRMNLML